MKRSFFGVLFALVLTFYLMACETKQPGETPAATPTPSVSEQTPAHSPAPLGEEEVRSIMESDGDYRVLNITPYEGDYVAEVTDHGGDRGWRALYWVFGETGEKVWLNRSFDMYEIDQYRILNHGYVEIRTTGKNVYAPVLELPRVYQVSMTVDSQGQLMGDYANTMAVACTDRTSHGGWRRLDGKSDVINNNPAYDGGISGRYEQLYEARIGVDDISFSFIPSGDSMDRFGSFFPACTSTPNMDCSFDPETRKFTIRFYNTALESGGITDLEIRQQHSFNGSSPYLDLYPYTFPKDSLGAGNRFVQDADTVLTLALTEYAYAYDVGRGDVGWAQDIPVTRVTFREYIYELDG